MSLLNPLMVKNFSGVTSITLTPPSGKSLRVMDIVIDGLAYDITIKIEKTYVGFMKAALNVQLEHDLTQGNSQYEEARHVGEKQTLIRRLQDLGIPMTYPVAVGENFILESSSGNIAGYIVYQEYDAGDVKNTELNGSASDHYIFVNYGRPTASITLPGYVDIDYPLTPTPFPDFPFGAAVPAGKKIFIHSLLIVAWGYNSYTGSADHISRVKYIKLIKDTESLFDRDMLGIQVYGASAAAGSSNVVANPAGSIFPYGFTLGTRKLGKFVAPLEFDEGSLVHAQAYAESVTNGDSVPLTIPYLGIVEEVMSK
ncbi:MAG: hypothetical protein GWP09_02385 [Nitrospiraceae bacterium]|nr:hypothetical protein [Nitrospiraceae bacterium]